MEARQAWTVNGARLAVAAPWLVLLLMSLPVRGDPPLRLAGGRRRPRRRRRRLRRRLPADDADRPAPDRAADPVVTPRDVGRRPRRASSRPGVLLVVARVARDPAPPAGRAGAALRPRPAAGRPNARRCASPRRRPTAAAAGVFGPLLRSLADGVERVLGGADVGPPAPRARRHRQDRARVPGRAGAVGARRVRRRRGVRRAPGGRPAPAAALVAAALRGRRSRSA